MEKRKSFSLKALYAAGLKSLAITMVLSGTVTAQTGQLTGKVIDQTTREPLSLAAVFIGGANLGATTGEEGEFIITNVPSGVYQVTVSYLGYKDSTLTNIRIEAGLTIDIGVLEIQTEPTLLRTVTITPGSFSVMGTAPLSRQTLTEKDLKNMSWAEDLTRALTRLPGVASSDYSSKFTIRGGETDEVLMILDGMELYEPFHQRDFAGGLFSIVDIETIQGVDLMTGGFSAEFGQRQSGVFQMKTKSVKPGEKHTSAGLSVMNARFYTDGTFNNNKGSYLFSARRGVLDLVLKAIGEDENVPIYYDAMGKLDYRLSDNHVLSFHGLQAGDKTSVRDIKPDNYDKHDTRYNNTYFWLTLNSSLSRDVFLRSMLYSGFISHQREGLFHKRDYGDKGDFTLFDKRSYDFLGAKQDWSFDISKRFALKAGFDFRQLNADYDYAQFIEEIRVNAQDSLYTYSRNIDIKTNPNGQLINVYLSGRWMVLPKLFTETGIRYDAATYADDYLWSPRIAIAYSLTEKSFIRAAWGRYYQSQFINNLDVNHNGTTFNPAELSTHYVLGFEHTFPKGLNVRLEGYYKDISRISPIYQNLRDPWEVFPESRNDVVKLIVNDAVAKGVEFFLKYDVGKKISWWFSYALAEAKDDIQDIEFDGIFIQRTGSQLRPNNQYHTVYADVNYRLNSKWHFNGSWQFWTGWPRTTYTYDFKALPLSNSLAEETAKVLPDGNLHFYQRHEEFNGVLYPAYQRMDIRVNRFFYKKNSKISAFIHLINVYNHQNLRKFDLGVTDEDERLVPDDNGGYVIFEGHNYWFGLTPVIGFNWEF